MELKDLSSNWKKLQEKLKKEKASASTTPVKRKSSDRETQNGVKRRKTETAGDKNIERQRQSLRRKRMSDGTGDGGAKEAEETVTEIASRRNSTSIAKAEPRTGKINEGLNPTSVYPTSFFSCLFCIADLTSAQSRNRQIYRDRL